MRMLTQVWECAQSSTRNLVGNWNLFSLLLGSDLQETGHAKNV